MDAPDDRLEVVDVERPRIEVAVPAGYIEWMVIEHDLVDAVVLLHQNRKVPHFIDRLDKRGTPDVALRVRRSLDQLPEFVAISFRPANVSAAFEDQNLGLLAGQLKPVAVENSPVNNEVVAFVERQRSVRGFENALPFADVNQLVGLRVSVEVRVVLVRLDVEHCDVLIEQQRNPVERYDATLFGPLRKKMSMP